MDINYVLTLIAFLNLGGDLYNILRFRSQLPRWIIKLNLGALTACGLAFALAPNNCGYIAIGVLVAYHVVLRLRTRSLRQIDTSSGTPITIAIIAINALFFAYQISQDAIDNPVNLIRVGALYSPLIEAGQWWRLLTAQFIHWGVAHLALNMLGLWFLGRTVERTLGSNRYIVSYLLCGAGGMTIAWLANFVTNMGNPMILLGASASVLGMVGLQAATSLMAYRKTGSVIAKAQLSAMTQIIALQVIFDLSVPQVSSTAHIGGAACGFIIGMFLTRRARTNIIVEH